MRLSVYLSVSLMLIFDFAGDHWLRRWVQLPTQNLGTNFSGKYVKFMFAFCSFFKDILSCENVLPL